MFLFSFNCSTFLKGNKMPCSDGGPSYSDEQQEKLDNVTRLLCNRCKIIESKGYLNKIDSETRNWYLKHKELDAIRELEERDHEARVRKEKLEQYLKLKKEFGDDD